MDGVTFGGVLQKPPAFMACNDVMGKADQCRSELAREKLKGAAFFLIYRVIVGDFREQARSYTGVA
ncbi:hypothetical protein HU730_011855 [Pseudomonas sp. SWRI22]|uniref:hypothetical protein n=1 Tax=Pseudomonas TaxID=286 RepID=UPI000B5B540D|nr:hypothetical protein [Pseudomonas sp.]MBV4510746.1 hypothetical protein [Pseudomonas sp. SWRI22]